MNLRELLSWPLVCRLGRADPYSSTRSRSGGFIPLVSALLAVSVGLGTCVRSGHTGQPATQPSCGGLSTQAFEQLWQRLSQAEYYEAYGAIQALATGGERTLELLEGRLRPVRMKAEEIAQAITNLDHSKYIVRNKAMKALSAVGLAAEPALLQALTKTPSAQLRVSIESLLRTCKAQKPVTPQSRRTIRAIWALERIGNDRAQELLKVLAESAPVACEAHEARMALTRLGLVPRQSIMPDAKLDLEQFAKEMALAGQAPGGPSRVDHLRKALSCRPDHPENMMAEFLIGIELSQHYDPAFPLQKPDRDAAIPIFEGVVDRYRHMIYHSPEPVDGSPQLKVAEAAHHAATLHCFWKGDPVLAREYWYRAMECIKQTHQQRIIDWRNQPRPKKPPKEFGGLNPEGKWRMRVRAWEKRKKDAAEGKVFGPVETLFVKILVTDFGESFGRQKAPDVARVMGLILRDFPGTPMAVVAQEHIDRAKAIPSPSSQPTE